MLVGHKHRCYICLQMSIRLARYSANRCRVTNIAPCVNTADDANYVKLSPKAQLKENFSSTEQRIKRELVVPKTSSLRALVWLRHMTIHVEICRSSWKPQYLGGEGMMEYKLPGQNISMNRCWYSFLTNPSSAGVIISWQPSLLLTSRKGAWSNRSSSVSVASGS